MPPTLGIGDSIFHVHWTILVWSQLIQGNTCVILSKPYTCIDKMLPKRKEYS